MPNKKKPLKKIQTLIFETKPKIVDKPIIVFFNFLEQF